MAERSIEIAAPREFVWNSALDYIYRTGDTKISPGVETSLEVPDLSGEILARFTDVIPEKLIQLEVDPESDLSVPIKGGEISVELTDTLHKRSVGTLALLKCHVDFAPRNRMESLRLVRVRSSIGLKALAAFSLFKHEVERSYRRAG